MYFVSNLGSTHQHPTSDTSYWTSLPRLETTSKSTSFSWGGRIKSFRASERVLSQLVTS